MKLVDSNDCKVHILVCVNERPFEKSSCKKVGGLELFTELKQRLKDTGLIKTHWITRTGCLGFCNDTGAVLTIYRKEKPVVWYSEVKREEMDQIWKEIIQ